MERQNAALRQDLIQNAVSHQMEELEADPKSQPDLNALFNSDLDHDLITWPRQYLEAYLDSDATGRVPLTPEQLQDVLEAAFERDEDLAIEFLAETAATKSPQSLPNSSLQIADVWQSDPQHPYELLFDPTDVHDVERLSTQVEGIARDRDHKPHLPPNQSQLRTERRESTTHLVEHRAGTDVINLHEKAAGNDIRKLLGGAELPKQVQSALEEFGPEARIDQALTDSGIYSGTVIAETVQNLIQKITQQSAVIHRKEDLDSVPQLGDHVRISYSNGVARVQQGRERSRSKELAL
jgi:hypothetical protein